MSLAAEHLTAPSGLPAWRAPVEAPRGGVLVLGLGSLGGGGRAPRNAPPSDASSGWLGADGPAAIVALLGDAGFTVVAPELGWRHADAPDPDDAVADPEVIADLHAARGWLPTGPRFVVGIGRGGVWARLAACAVRGLDGAVSFGGRVWYSGVSAQRPIQPLDLLPGLGCALQCHVDLSDPDTPAGPVEELERRLGGLSRPWQVFRYPAGAAAAGWSPRAAPAAWARTRSFLLHLAAERA